MGRKTELFIVMTMYVVAMESTFASLTDLTNRYNEDEELFAKTMTSVSI